MINKLYENIKSFFKENYKFLLFLICLILFLTYEFPYIIYRTGGTIPLSERVEVEKKYEEEGTLSMSYVTASKGTIPFILLSFVLPDWDLVPLSDVTSSGSYDNVIEVGREYMDEGIDNAIISAFKLSSYKIDITKTINKVIYLSEEAKTNIKIGDEIISVNDKNIGSITELQEYINTLKENDKVNIKVLNDGKEFDREATIYKAEDDTLKIGIAFHTTYEYKTEIPVSVKMKNSESGSSGSFMMSLAIYNALTEEDITKGLDIVGTGSITSDGVIEEIGGVKYKILGASKKGADIFFCPEENYEEAKKVKDERHLKIDVVKVHTLEEAINYLKNK